MTEEIEKEISYENIPFEEQKKYGFFKSFGLTVYMLVRTPSDFFRRMHVNKGLGYPFIFLLIVLTVSNVMNYIYIKYNIIESPAEQITKALESSPELKTQAEVFKSMFDKEATLWDIPVSIFANFGFMFLLAAYWHLILLTMKIAGNGFEATVRIFCYSSVILLTSVFPISSPLLNFAVYMWWAFIMYKGISEAHEVSLNLAWRGMTISLLATMIPFILFAAAFF
ncbi:MAG TPA: Yip1 family protein [Clostridiales bacterium]|nr:Yip1 family protein [Clostridiales bacterium]HQP68859.1 Yip1 family protein [Clostridiales bacterium]